MQTTKKKPSLIFILVGAVSMKYVLFPLPTITIPIQYKQ